jgi:NodT family efflux transporter outer membrane factor (OMF) lipoprotein
VIALLLALLSPALGAEVLDAQSRYANEGGEVTSSLPWWETFEDPLLAALVEEGIVGNPDVGGAIGRLKQADGAFWQTRAGLLPQVNFEVRSSHQAIIPGSFVPPGVDPSGTQNTMQMGFTGNYSVDPFGRTALNARASRYERLAAEGDRDAAAVAMATRVGEAYYDLAASRARERVLYEQLDANRKLLEIVELRRDAAGATTVDVLQQRQQVAVLEASLPSVEASVDLATYRLGALLGRTEPAAPVETNELPAVSELPATGLPVDLLDNRPDLRAASGRSTSARARETASYLGFLPTFQVNGLLGWQTLWFGTQKPTFNEGWQVSTTVTMPLFGGGGRHGAVRSARGADYSASEAYRGAVIGALQEVEGAILSDRAAQARLTASIASTDLARASYERSLDQWLEGLSTYLTVFTNLGAWQRAELDLVDARRQSVGARIQLHDALGGAWTRDLGERKAR